MPKNNQKPKSRKNRRASTPNVFVQNRNVEDEDQSAQDTSATTTEITAPRTRVRVERATRSASVRSEIYTRSQFPAHTMGMQKIGNGLDARLILAHKARTFH